MGNGTVHPASTLPHRAGTPQRLGPGDPTAHGAPAYGCCFRPDQVRRLPLHRTQPSSPPAASAPGEAAGLCRDFSPAEASCRSPLSGFEASPVPRLARSQTLLPQNNDFVLLRPTRGVKVGGFMAGPFQETLQKSFAGVDVRFYEASGNGPPLAPYASLN